MAELTGNLLVAQSGGPTAVINASVAGVITEAGKHECIEEIYGGLNGILGILNGEEYQLILSDTPGILDPQYPLHKSMMKAVDEALQDADILIVLVELGEKPERAEAIIRRAERFSGPLFVLVNKMDTGTDADLVAGLEAWERVFPKAKVVPISALHGFNVEALRERLIALLPEHPPFFPKDDMSDRDLRFFTSEMIREKVLSLYKQEIPYSTQVVVNSYEEGAELVKIQADVIVMRESQKGIVIGRGGGALRQLGTEARKAIEKFCGTKVFLDLRVKVDPDWREDERKLKRYGY